MKFPLTYNEADAYQGHFFRDADDKYIDFNDGLAELQRRADVARQPVAWIATNKDGRTIVHLAKADGWTVEEVLHAAPSNSTREQS